MFRRRKSKPDPNPTPPTLPPAPGGDELDQTLDTMAAILRVLGDFAFDLADQPAEELRSLYETWARHVLVGAPRPGSEAAPGAPSSPARRDWIGVRQFVSDHRRRESTYVTRGFDDLKQVIWVFIQGLGRAVPADEKDDRQVSDQLSRLRQAIQGHDTEYIKREALASIQLVERVVAERKERQQHTIAGLAQHMERIGNELTHTGNQASMDALTGIPDRAAFNEHLERLANLGLVFGRPACLFLVDIDDFKWVNDRFGSPSGDEVLRQVARCLRRVFRRRGDFTARIGGDELAAVIGEASLEAANRLAERLLFSVRDLAVEHEGSPIRVTVSIGVARLGPGEDPKSWLARASRALDAARQFGCDRVVVDSPG